MRPELAILESIYAHTDDLWEQCPLRLPPFAMFSDYGVTTDDVAELLVELQAEYDFPVVDYPECIQDVVDLVMCRPFVRLQRQADRQAAAAYNFSTKPKTKQTILTKIKNLMKHILPLTLLALLILTSCSKEDNTPAITRTITFTLSSPDITIEPLTRAALTDANLTDLYVWEGTTLLAHKQSTDADFASPSLNLAYGQHSLTFVASSSDNQTWTEGVWSTTHIIDIFAHKTTINIDGSSSATQSVELTRRSSRVKFLSTDLIPTSVKTMHLTVANHKSLDKDLKGGTAYTHEATVDITSKQGSVFSVFVNTLTESPTTEEDCSVMIEFLSSTNAVLYHYERTVSLLPNRLVTLKGDYFTSASNSITLASTNWDTTEQALFE